MTQVTAVSAAAAKPLARREARDIQQAERNLLERVINKFLSDAQQKVLVAKVDIDLVTEVLRHYVLVHKAEGDSNNELLLASVFEARYDAPESQIAWELWQELIGRAKSVVKELDCEHEKLLISYIILRVDDQLSFRYRQQLIKKMKEEGLQHLF